MNLTNITPEEFQQAAVTFRREFLRLPLIGANATLQHMTIRPGIRYKEIVGAVSADAEVAPYVAGKMVDTDIDLVVRELETFFGSVNANFEPNSVIQTIIGHMASQAAPDGLANTASAKEVLACVAKSVSQKLNMAIFSAKRNPKGTTTQDLFNGFDTITDSEIKNGAISADAGNYIKLDEKISEVNAADIAKKILWSMDDSLREVECNLYCTQQFADAYNESYLLTHGGVSYYEKYGQGCVEGSNGMLKIVPLASKKNSKYIHVSPKSNMLVGVDQMSDYETVRVKEFAPDVVTMMIRMFFGCQFESVDKRRLLVVESI